MQEDAYISQKPVKLIESTLVALALSHLICTDEQTTRCFKEEKEILDLHNL
jgi:hypothetical protein